MTETQREREAGTLIGRLDPLAAALVPNIPAAKSHTRHAWFREIPAEPLALATLRAVIGTLSQRPNDEDDEEPLSQFEREQGGAVTGSIRRRVQEVGRAVGIAAWRTHVLLKRPRATLHYADLLLEEQGTKLHLGHLTRIGFRLLYALHAARPELLVFHEHEPVSSRTAGRGRAEASPRFSLGPTVDVALQWVAQEYRPMIEPPLPWTEQRRGGYKYRLAEAVPLVRNVNVSEQDPPCDPVVYEALNALQSVPWRINCGVLAASQPATDLTEQEQRIVAEATHDADHAALYYVHACDFRGRVYPTGTWLTPQGPDLARALLEFAEGCPIAPSTAAQDALKEYATACEAKREKKPWLALAARRELAAMTQAHERGETFDSHLPMWRDASANGLQHMALLRRDPSLWDHVSGAAPDIYETIAAAFTRRVNLTDVPQGTIGAGSLPLSQLKQLYPKGFDRDFAKPAASIFGYGATLAGIREYFVEDLGDARLGGYVASLLMAVLKEQLPQAVALGQHFAKIGRAIAPKGSTRPPATWQVPGTKFSAGQRHSFEWKRDQRVRFKWPGTEMIYVRVPTVRTATITSKHATSLAPNIVHSLDAAHLMLTVRAFRQRFPDAPVGTVHDNFATWATRADDLQEHFEAMMAELYDGGLDPLRDLEGQFADQVAKAGGKMPDPLPQGTLPLKAARGEVGAMKQAGDDAFPVTPALAGRSLLKP